MNTGPVLFKADLHGHAVSLHFIVSVILAPLSVRCPVHLSLVKQCLYNGMTHHWIRFFIISMHIYLSTCLSHLWYNLALATWNDSLSFFFLHICRWNAISSWVSLFNLLYN